jgi:hypothetical protein
MSASVSLSPTRKSFPVRSFSTLSRASKSSTTAFSYAACVVANPDLYTPSEKRHDIIALNQETGMLHRHTIDVRIDPFIDRVNLGT